MKLGCAIKPDLLWLMRLVVITEAGARGRGHEEVAREALEGGCRAIQMRDKEMPDPEFEGTALRIRELCRERHALFFVNDRVEAALAVGADGVHLGVDDMDVAGAREALPPGSIIGFSPESMEEAREAVARGADYLGIGPVFGSSSKIDAGEPIGLQGITRYSRAGLAPVVGVGGITAATAASVTGAGAAGVAVISAVTRSIDVRGAVAGILEQLGRDRRVKRFGGGR